MTLRSIIVCDSCGRTQHVTSTTEVAGAWGSLRVGTATPRDICPTCIAQLGGWGTTQPSSRRAAATRTFPLTEYAGTR